MSITEMVYNFNVDGSVRAEFVITGYGVMPLGYYAKALGTSIIEAIEWKKADLRGMLLNAKNVNDAGQKCDKCGTPVEDENFALLPDSKADEWNHQLWVKHNGTSALTDKEWQRLSPEDKPSYRRLNCMEVRLAAELKTFPNAGPLYITEEAVPTLAEMLISDVLTGDPIVRRYQHECKFNEGFAEKFSFALNMALDELHGDSEEVIEGDLQKLIAHAIMSYCGRPTIHHDMIFGAGHVDDDGNEVSDDNEATMPVDAGEDASSHH